MKLFSKTIIPEQSRALPGREAAMPVPACHYVLQRPLKPPFPEGFEVLYLGLGCFWGAERLFWQQDGVYTTAVGYAGGFTPNPTYEEVCSGGTGHAEVVLVVYDPSEVAARDLLAYFWESHDPTQGMRQGNDSGTQYRSVIYTTTPEQKKLAEQSRQDYRETLKKHGFPDITTDIQSASEFYYAEDYHQQYLAKNPQGYCGIGGTGICLPPSLEVMQS